MPAAPEPTSPRSRRLVYYWAAVSAAAILLLLVPPAAQLAVYAVAIAVAAMTVGARLFVFVDAGAHRHVVLALAVVTAFWAVALGFGAARGSSFELARPDLAHLAVLVAAAVIEEIFFRGLIQGGSDRLLPTRRRVFGVPVGAGLIVGALLFAVAHVPAFGLAAGALRLLPGLVLGTARATTGTLIAPILIHVLWNLGDAFVHIQ